MDQRLTPDQQDQLINQQINGLDNLEFPYVIQAYFYKVVNDIIWNGKSNGIIFGQGYKNIIFLHPDEMQEHKISINSANFTKNLNLNTSESADFKMKQTRTFQIEGTAEFLKDNQWFVSLSKPLNDNPTKEELNKMLWVSKVDPTFFITNDEFNIMEKLLDNEKPDIIRKQLTNFELSDREQFKNSTGNFIEIIYLNKLINLNKLTNSVLDSITLKNPRDTLFNYISCDSIESGTIRKKYFTLQGDYKIWPFKIEPLEVNRNLILYFPWFSFYHLGFRILNELAVGEFGSSRDASPLFALSYNENSNIPLQGKSIFQADFTVLERNKNGDLLWTETRTIFGNQESPVTNHMTIYDRKMYVMGHEPLVMNDYKTPDGQLHPCQVIEMGYSNMPSTVVWTQNNNNNAVVTNAFMRLKLIYESSGEIVNMFNQYMRSTQPTYIKIWYATDIRYIYWKDSTGNWDKTYIGEFRQNILGLFYADSQQASGNIRLYGIQQNSLSDLIKLILAVNFNYKSTMSKALFDSQKNPINNIAIIKEYINNFENLEQSLNALIDNYLSVYANYRILNEFKERFINLISFINALGNKLNMRYSIPEGQSNNYNAFWIQLDDNVVASNQIPDVFVRNIIKANWTNTEHWKYLNLNSRLKSEYFTIISAGLGNIRELVPLIINMNGNLTVESPFSNLLTGYKLIDNTLDEKVLDTDPKKITLSKEEYQKYLFLMPYFHSPDNSIFLANLFGSNNSILNREKFNSLLSDNLKTDDSKDYQVAITNKFNNIEFAGIWGGEITLKLNFKDNNNNINSIIINTELFNSKDESVVRTNFIF